MIFHTTMFEEFAMCNEFVLANSSWRIPAHNNIYICASFPKGHEEVIKYLNAHMDFLIL